MGVRSWNAPVRTGFITTQPISCITLAGPLGDVVTTAQVDEVTLLRPDVALVACTKRIIDRRADAADALPTEGRLTYVLVDDGAGWRIASAQTTPVRV